MYVTDFPHLPRSLYPQLGVLGLLDRDTPQDIAFVRHFRALRLPVAEYYAVYAIDEGRILSRVEVVRPQFTSEGGSEVVCGLADVSTRPDSVRRGLAGRLIREVHRRESALGLRWSFLWTRRSWGAHSLYERLGYRDVYSPPSALRPSARRRPRPLPSGYEWVPATRRDIPTLERTFRRSTKGRLGFIARPPGLLAARIRMGWRVPENHRILLHRGTAAGYAHLVFAPWHVGANEVLVDSPEHVVPMIDALESTAPERSISLGSTTFVRDAQRELERRGYSIYPLAHLTLMARRLTRERRPVEDPVRVCADPRFSCHRGDTF